MGVLENDVKNLLDKLEKSQWTGVPLPDISVYPILTRQTLQNMKMEPGVMSTKTSGSTGIPVKVEKSYADLVWFQACVIREFLWKKWDWTKNVAIIKPKTDEKIYPTWGLPLNIAPTQGKMYSNDFLSISELQKWFEKVNPNYIQCYKSIFDQIDTSKISNFIEWKGTGEKGGTCYSSEECGVIALQCPDNPNNYHVMENQFIEIDDDGSALITTFTNPHIKRYKHGDVVELGECTCGRKLQTITKIHGRIRNMFKFENGDMRYPIFGSQQFHEKFGIKQFKCIQHSYNKVELQIISEQLGEKEDEVKDLVRYMLELPVEVELTYVEKFPNYKHEEFISLV